MVTTNFTNLPGTVNETWQSGIAIFTAQPGLVTLGSDINYQGMIFSAGGTNIQPGTLVAAASGALGTGIVQMFNGTLILSGAGASRGRAS